MELQEVLQENGNFSFKPEIIDSPKAPRKAKRKGLSFKPGNGISIQPAIAELEKVYVAMAPVFGNLVGLPLPRIVIQSQGRRKHTLGWFSPRRWVDAQAEMDPERALVHEVTICAEELKRSLMETIGTLLHEMVHVSNWYAQVQDVGKDGRYHNQKFKHKAESIGLIVEKDMRLGWALTEMGPELQRHVSGLNVNEQAFAVFRIGMPEREKQPTKMKKWTCGCTIVRCATELTATCQTCGNLFANVDRGEEPQSAPVPEHPGQVPIHNIAEGIEAAQTIAQLMTRMPGMTEEQISDLDAISDSLEGALEMLGVEREEEPREHTMERAA